MRVLVFDAGMNLGYGAVGGGRIVTSGSRRLRGGPRDMGVTAEHAREIILAKIADEKPDLVGFASPFVGQTWDAEKKRWRPIAPDNIRPLFGIIAIIEMVCRDMGIPCCEVEEGEARRHLLGTGNLPKGTKAIKEAIQRAIRERNWSFCDDHSADALCVASYIWECKNPDQAHRTTPLFRETRNPR